MSQTNIGYDDTPVLPGIGYKVHDGARPFPPIIEPGVESTQDAPGRPPSDAVVLFDGSGLEKWQSRRGGPVGWKLEGDWMEVVPGTGDIETIEHFGDCQLHVEWAAPVEVKGDSQGRGNSGVFLMGRYEIQVLDCRNNPTYADGTTGAIYGQWPPLVNACREPGQWQMYDIVWEGPRLEGDTLVKPARVTVFHNGVLLHHAKELQGTTCYRALASYEPHEPVGPLALQDHSHYVRFRNIWYRPLKGYDGK